MFIKSIKLSYFKGFSSNNNELTFKIPDGQNVGSGLNIFIGENNTGKSTIFEAINFLRDEVKDVNIIKTKQEDGSQPNHASIELTFAGNILEVIENFAPANKQTAFRNAVVDNELKAYRDTENLKELKLWHNGNFENVSGIAAPFKKMFENNFIWADTNPSDEVSFGTSTMCGALLKEIATAHTQTGEYQSFTQQFDQVFNNPNSELRAKIAEIEQKIQQVFTEQFGQASIKFKFENVDISSYFKTAELMIDDGIETAMSEKGNGMQRAVALALLQVYAEALAHEPEQGVTKPFYLFIDEPEICLHPRGQKKLFDALLEISKTKQVFLTTHSPYFLISPYLRNAGLFIFYKNGMNNTVDTPDMTKTFPWSPTWGEINFKAYKVPTVEFHNELYGFLQAKSGRIKINKLEEWLLAPEYENLEKTKLWLRDNNNEINHNAEREPNVTLQTFIRNHIHHSENMIMRENLYSYNDLERSITEMLTIISRLNLSTTP